MKLLKQIFNIILWISLGMALMPSLTRAEKNMQAQLAIPVETSQVSEQEINETLSFVGDIKALDETILYSKVKGKLIEYKVKEGEKVDKDMTIALVDRDEVGFKYENAPVIATISGTLGRNYLDRGSDIDVDTPVTLIVNLESVRAVISVVERHIPQIHLGQKAYIYTEAYPEAFEGTIWKISPVVEPQTRSAPVEVIIQNPQHQLLPGMFAKVKVIISTNPHALVIPEESIVSIEGKNFVFVVEDSVARRRKVTLGVRQPGLVEITEGLQKGETIVKAGHQKLHDGTMVSMINNNTE
ncbi:MAG: efflux RND transporter periplasmic adaptor subunit [Chlamydiota bacterium]|nr:efflux RND transporter periplasmic adaptor subunit [Chlamydiota bacterium]